MKITGELCDKIMMYKTAYNKSTQEVAALLNIGTGTVSRTTILFSLVQAEAWDELTERLPTLSPSAEQLTWVAERTGKTIPENILTYREEKVKPSESFAGIYAALELLHQDLEVIASKLGNVIGKQSTLENIIDTVHKDDRALINTCVDVIVDEMRATDGNN